MYDGLVARLRLFASAREAAGTSQVSIAGATVAEILDRAKHEFGPSFESILPTCRVWVNGEEAAPSTRVEDGDEVAVLPPVSGGDS